MNRYSACGSTLDELIQALSDARDHGARGESTVMIFGPDSGEWEAMTGFTINPDELTLKFYSDEP